MKKKIFFIKKTKTEEKNHKIKFENFYKQNKIKKVQMIFTPVVVSPWRQIRAERI